MVSMSSTSSREELILRTGREILASDGLRALTTREVARRAHVSKKTLYGLFPSKEELVVAVVSSFLEEYLAHWDEVFDGPGPAIDRIVASLDFASHFLPQIQVRLIAQAEGMPLSLWEKIDAIRLKRVRKFRALLKEAQRDGILRDDVDPDHWILLLTATIQGALTPAVLLKTRIPLPALVGTIRMIYYEGLLTEKGRRYVTTQQAKEKR